MPDIMLYSTVITQICTQMGDPDGKSFDARAKYHFERAVAQILNEGAYTLDDLRGYHKVKTDLDFTSNPATLTERVLKIIDILPDPLSLLSSRYTVKIKPIEELNLVSSDEEHYPTNEEVYIYKIGGTSLYAVYNTSDSNFKDTDTLYMYYIEEPNLVGYTTQEMATLFSLNFIYKAIDLAVKNLKIEESITE